MAKKQWSVEIGFNKFDGCPKKHKAFEICDGCREHQGVMRVKVVASNHTWAAWLAVDKFGQSDYYSEGYSLVTLTMDGDATERLPSLRRAASQKPRSPPEPKGSTASKKGSAQKRGGKGQRKS